MIDKLKAAGREPVLSHIPYSPDGNHDTLDVFNTVIDELTQQNGLQIGPDLTAWFKAHSDQFTDKVHPNYDGQKAMNTAVGGRDAPPVSVGRGQATNMRAQLVLLPLLLAGGVRRGSQLRRPADADRSRPGRLAARPARRRQPDPGPRRQSRRAPRRQPLGQRIRVRSECRLLRRPVERVVGVDDQVVAQRQRRAHPAQRELLAGDQRRQRTVTRARTTSRRSRPTSRCCTNTI